MSTRVGQGTSIRTSAPTFDIRFPDRSTGLDQDEEWFEATIDGTRRRMLIHDYARLYEVQGLYDELVYDALGCSSPHRVVELIVQSIRDWPRSPADLRVLDLGAGNGVVGEELRTAGVDYIVGLDILSQAKTAAMRDRPDVYDEYIVTDLTTVQPETSRQLEAARLNCLVTVAALGFGDIPPAVFLNAFNAIADDGWVAMTIKEDFLDADDTSGFSRLLRHLISTGHLELQAHQRYVHRVSVEDERLFYVALVGRKTGSLAQEDFDRIRQADTEEDVNTVLRAIVSDA